MRRAGGILIATSPDGTRETDTFTCSHCQTVCFVEPRERPEDIGGLCKQCMKLICPRCVDAGVCVPWEKEMERQEARYHALRSYGMVD